MHVSTPVQVKFQSAIWMSVAIPISTNPARVLTHDLYKSELITPDFRFPYLYFFNLHVKSKMTNMLIRFPILWGRYVVVSWVTQHFNHYNENCHKNCWQLMLINTSCIFTLFLKYWRLKIYLWKYLLLYTLLDERRSSKWSSSLWRSITHLF